MKRIITLVFCFVFVLPAYADFDTGLDAYLKNDYAKAVKEFKPLAEQGDPDAQYMLGHMYASGKGVPQDFVQAHVWFNLAAAQGKTKAIESRDEMTKVMTPQQIAEAQQIVRNWEPQQIEEEPPHVAETQDAPSDASDTELIQAIQTELTSLGFDPGPVDGQMGSKTSAAIRKYQAQSGLTVDGQVSHALLAHLQERSNKEKVQLQTAQKLEKTAPEPESPGDSPQAEEHLRNIIKEVNRIISRGSQKKVKKEEVLSALRKLIQRYDPLWPVVLLQDDFSDGDFTQNPVWSVVSGNYQVDNLNRLRTVIKPGELQRDPQPSQGQDTTTIIVGTLIKELLKDRATVSTPPEPPSRAEIYSELSISNAFSLTLEVSLLSKGAEPLFECGLYQGRHQGQGYYLRYASGSNPTIELRHRTSNGTLEVIEVSSVVPDLTDGQSHAIQWQRFRNGVMRVLVDGKKVIQKVDRTTRQNFDGISVANLDGEYAISKIEIQGAPPK